MFLSTREAAERMAVLGVDRESARCALLAGVAGPAVVTRSARLHTETAIDALVARCAEPLDPEEIASVCPRGAFVARLAPRRPAPADDWRSWRGADMTAPAHEQRLAACGWWRIAPLTRILIDVRAEREGPLPFVGTVAGFVVVGAAIVRVAERDSSGPAPGRSMATRLDLVAPGAWFERFAGRRIQGPSGGAWFGWPAPLWAAAPQTGPGRIAG